MIGLNKFQFIGDVTKEPESGENKVIVNLAVNREFRDREGHRRRYTDYFAVFFYNKDAANITALVHAGDSLYVEGRIEHNTVVTEYGEHPSYKFRAIKFILVRRDKHE